MFCGAVVCMVFIIYGVYAVCGDCDLYYVHTWNCGKCSILGVHGKLGFKDILEQILFLGFFKLHAVSS